MLGIWVKGKHGRSGAPIECEEEELLSRLWGLEPYLTSELVSNHGVYTFHEIFINLFTCLKFFIHKRLSIKKKKKKWRQTYVNNHNNDDYITIEGGIKKDEVESLTDIFF